VGEIMSSSGGIISAQITGPLPAGTNVIGVVDTARTATVSWSQPATAVTTSGQSTSFSSSTRSELGVDLDVTAMTGTSPTIQFYLHRYGADGVAYILWQSALITTTGQISTSVGAGTLNANTIGETNYLSWTVSGTTPSITFSGSIIAK